MLLHAPAARPAAEDVGVVEEAIEERADGGDIAEELAPVLDRPVRAEQCADPLVPALDELEEVLGRGGRELPHAQVIELCGAPHNSTNGERPVMWSVRRKRR